MRYPRITMKRLLSKKGISLEAYFKDMSHEYEFEPKKVNDIDELSDTTDADEGDSTDDEL